MLPEAVGANKMEKEKEGEQHHRGEEEDDGVLTRQQSGKSGEKSWRQPRGASDGTPDVLPSRLEHLDELSSD